MKPEIEEAKVILLVDDDPRDVEFTLAALEEQKVANKVAVVNDGEQALDYLYCRGQFANRPGGNPLVIVLDNKMPKITGLEVLKEVKADEHLRMIPVVAFTSSREARDVDNFYRHGGNAYVVKPMKFAEYVAAVRQIAAFWTTINLPPATPKA